MARLSTPSRRAPYGRTWVLVVLMILAIAVFSLAAIVLPLLGSAERDLSWPEPRRSRPLWPWS